MPSRAALPELGLAAAFLIAWIAPRVLGGQVAESLKMLMLTELPVTVVAAMAAFALRHKDLSRTTQIGVLVGYTPIALVIGLGFTGSVVGVIACMAQIYNRLAPVLWSPQGSVAARVVMARYVLPAIGFYVLTGAAVMMAWPPDFFLWGLLYFTSLGLFELILGPRIERRLPPGVAPTDYPSGAGAAPTGTGTRP